MNEWLLDPHFSISYLLLEPETKVPPEEFEFCQVSKMQLHLKGREEWLIWVGGINLDTHPQEYIGGNLTVSSTLWRKLNKQNCTCIFLGKI